MVMVEYSARSHSESMNYVHYIWILLSILVSVTCSFCFLQPEWIKHPNVRNAFGIYAFCVGNTGSAQFSRTCGFYGGRFGFGNIPCTIWQAACLLYGGGSLFTCFGALCSLTTMCVRKSWNKTLVLSTRYLQISSVFLMTSGLLVFPLGFDSNYFRLYCGAGADVFNSGICHVGWTYVLAIVGAAISIFCPILSYFSAEETSQNEEFDFKI
ncbi:LHFPL tetraspan subfamily member 7 protein-like [Ruditapes philippinarum]|uniref:LHFPL tetraspan subfamily member 7 protein-like n=1 Tax=Ruditapes philippinarum TaxID=129788 RepID=UPI00295AFCF2|nr:LHFPL tetraspan subfamily member 7 protein-like [Ruditapes philippinarum]